jgi:hypothetical protein
MRLTCLDWRRETVYLLTAAMEVAWFTPWYLALIPATARLSPERTAVGLFMIMVIPAYGARLLVRLRLKPRIQGAALVSLLVLTCLLAMHVFLYAGQGYEGFDWLGETLQDVLDVYQFIPDWLIIVLSTMFLWWRGIRLGQRRPSVRAVGFGFYIGIVSFVGFVLIVNLVTREDPSGFIPVFFFCSLMALAAARMDEMQGRRGAMRSSFGFHWLFSIALAALTVVLLGVLLGALLAGLDIRSVLGWIEPLLFLVGIVFGLFIVLLRTMAGWALGFLGSFGVENAAVPLAEFVEELGELVPDGSELTIQGPPGLGAVRLALMVALVVGLGALLMFLARRQSWTQRESEADDEESVFSPTLIVENLRQLVRAARGRLAVALGFVGRSGWHGLFVAVNIRRIYAQMQRLAARQGYPRTASQTPYEYESIAVRAFPDAVAEVHTITEAYVAVHYGEVPESDAELQEIRASWERLEESVRKWNRDW